MCVVVDQPDTQREVQCHIGTGEFRDPVFDESAFSRCQYAVLPSGVDRQRPSKSGKWVNRW